MDRKIIITSDGSTTIQLPSLNEQYHSKHGAIAEAQHVFIKNGLDFILKYHKTDPLNILEIGFGTGLNALITSLEIQKYKKHVFYTGVEAYPITIDETLLLNYTELLSHQQAEVNYKKIHKIPWNIKTPIHTSFELLKKQQLFEDIQGQKNVDLILL